MSTTTITRSSLSERIAAHVLGTRFEDIPEAARHAAKLSILDTLAVAWAGLGASGVAEARAVPLDLGGRPDARLWGFSQRLPATEAAFANGVAAAALDFDALHQGGTVHADIVALPALLAVAERVHATGRAWLTAHILTVDLIARLGLAAPGHQGWFYTSIHGVFGAAAGAARLLGLDGAGVVHALGLALPQAGGTQQPMVEQSLAKRLQAALAARGGVYAALLAAQGLGAPREVFEGRFGAFAMYEPADAALVLEDLGARWENTGIGFKKYPNCGCAHAPLDAALSLIESHDLRPADVTDIRVVLTPYSYRLVGADYAPHDRPEVAAQFSIQYAIATALLHRCFGVEALSPERALASEALALARRVRVEVDPGATGRMLPACVEFTTGRGVLGLRAPHVPGSPEAPLTDAEVLAKARSCLASGPRGLSGAAIEILVDRVLHVETLEDTRDLWASVA